MGFRFNSDSITPASGGGGSTTAISVENKNTTVGATNPLNFWEGTENQWNNGVSQTWYNWQGGSTSGWTKETPDVANLHGVTYGNNKYITVGDNGTILSSSDGSNWVNETSGVSDVLQDITYGNNKFIAVGGTWSDNGSIILSSSGNGTWTKETSEFEYGLYGVTYGNNKYIAVGANRTIISSSDGSNWSADTVSHGSFYDVTYGNNKFIAVGTDGAIISSDGNGTWTTETSGVYYSLYGVTYGNNKFIAVGDHGTIISSSDGSTWTRETSGVSNDIMDVTYGDNKFVAVGYGPDYEAVVYSSSDGSIWTKESLGGDDGLEAITYGNTFIAVGYNAIWVYSSSGIPLKVFTTDEQPTTSSQVYSAPNTTSALTITSVGTSTITLSDTNTYNYNEDGNQTTTQTIGEAHPDWLCFIEGVGIKKGNTKIA